MWGAYSVPEWKAGMLRWQKLQILAKLARLKFKIILRRRMLHWISSAFKGDFLFLLTRRASVVCNESMRHDPSTARSYEPYLKALTLRRKSLQAASYHGVRLWEVSSGHSQSYMEGCTSKIRIWGRVLLRNGIALSACFRNILQSKRLLTEGDKNGWNFVKECPLYKMDIEPYDSHCIEWLDEHSKSSKVVIHHYYKFWSLQSSYAS